MYPSIIDGYNKAGSSSFFSENKIDFFNQIKNTGAILFRNFNLQGIDDFNKAIQCLHNDFAPYIGGDSPRKKLKDNIYTSTEYPADQEKSFSNTYPKFAYFFCDIEPKIGGETPILDSRALYKQLNLDIITKFSEKQLKYVMNLHNGNGIGKSWQQTFEVNKKQELEKILNNMNVIYKWKDNDLLEISEIVNPIIQHLETKEYF